MFEIRVITDPADADFVAVALSAAFATDPACGPLFGPWGTTEGQSRSRDWPSDLCRGGGI